MKKALLLAITALSLVSCNETMPLKAGEAEWLNDADKIRVYDYSGVLEGFYEKSESNEFWYKLNSERSITVKSINKYFDENALTKLYSNVTYVITFKETDK